MLASLKLYLQKLPEGMIKSLLYFTCPGTTVFVLCPCLILALKEFYCLFWREKACFFNFFLTPHSQTKQIPPLHIDLVWETRWPMVSALNSQSNGPGSSPGGGAALCSWPRHFTLSASLHPGV